MLPKLRTTKTLCIENIPISKAFVQAVEAKCIDRLIYNSQYSGYDCVELTFEGRCIHSFFPFVRIDGQVYAMGETLGKGTYGMVMVGMKLRTQELVAIKTQKCRKQEADHQAQMSKCFGLGHLGGVTGPTHLDYGGGITRNYIVLPLATRTLYKHIESRPSLQEMYEILYKVAIQLKEIHMSGRIHYDLKPDNILMFENEPYITDLGLCSTIGKSVAKYPGSPTKYRHCCPESFGSGYYIINPTADIYSFGYVIECCNYDLRDQNLYALQQSCRIYDPRSRISLDRLIEAFGQRLKSRGYSTLPKVPGMQMQKFKPNRVATPARRFSSDYCYDVYQEPQPHHIVISPLRLIYNYIKNYSFDKVTSIIALLFVLLATHFVRFVSAMK